MIRRRDIVEGLKSRGYKVEAHTNVKNGVEMRGIRFMESSGICPVVYTDTIIEESDYLSDAIDTVLDTYHNADIMEFDKEKLTNPKFILENLYIGLQKESQEEIVKMETNFDGIEKYLYVRINNEALFKLTSALLETIQIDTMSLWKIAEENTFTETKIVSMKEMFFEMLRQEMEKIDDISEQYIVSNKTYNRGASAILNTESLKSFAEKINKHRFFVLPSSIHEMIIVPDDGKCNVEELNAMVAEVNQTQVEPEERLTDRAYIIEV